MNAFVWWFFGWAVIINAVFWGAYLITVHRFNRRNPGASVPLHSIAERNAKPLFPYTGTVDKLQWFADHETRCPRCFNRAWPFQYGVPNVFRCGTCGKEFCV